jgi:hypothetical protein
LNAELLRRWAFSIGAALLLLWVASRRTFFGDTISSAFLAVALFSIFLILLRTRRDLRELGLVAVSTGVLYLVDICWLGYSPGWPVMASFVGMAGLLALALRAIWAADAERRTAYLTLIPAFLFVASEWGASYFLEWGEKARPLTLDLYLFSFDASLHVQPAFVMGQWFAGLPALAFTSVMIYLALPIAIGLVFAGCVVRDRARAMPSVVAFLITGPIGACFYAMFPALGPVHIFLDKFPWHPLAAEQVRNLLLEPIAVAGPRNAIPSLHAAWIFLVFWYARRLSLLERIGAGIFVLFTLCATLGTGEHYFVDLVVAVPFSVFILALTQMIFGENRRAAAVAMGAGFGGVLLWFAVLRWENRLFWVSPVVPWGACVATVALGWCFARKLEARA